MKSNRTAESREYAREGLRAWRQCNGACEAFAALASIALAEGRAEDAARIAGYAESILAREGIERDAQLRAIEEITGRIDARITEVARKKLLLFPEGAMGSLLHADGRCAGNHGHHGDQAAYRD